MRTFSVLLADSYEAYREGLARTLATHPRLELVAEAADGRQALEDILRIEPDIAVLEVRMPRLDGLGVCAILAGLDRPVLTRLALISGEINDTLVAAAKAMGVEVVLDKDLTRSQLCQRICELGDSPRSAD